MTYTPCRKPSATSLTTTGRARESGAWRRNPSDKDAVRIHVLTAGEEMLYFDDAKRFPALHDLGRLMLNQGCRPEEILALQISDIDLVSFRMSISDGKSRAARRKLRLTERVVRSALGGFARQNLTGCSPAEFLGRVRRKSMAVTMMWLTR